MKIDIELYDTATAVAWAVVTFLIVGMSIARKRSR
jgi:hypothetical protein